MAKPQMKANDRPRSITAVSYRIEKIDQYNWQPIRVVLYSDESYVEEMAFKADVLEIVSRKVFNLMRDEATKAHADLKAEQLASGNH